MNEGLGELRVSKTLFYKVIITAVISWLSVFHIDSRPFFYERDLVKKKEVGEVIFRRKLSNISFYP